MGTCTWAPLFPKIRYDEDDAGRCRLSASFPRKISLIFTEEAEGAIAELIAFLATFLKRVFALGIC